MAGRIGCHLPHIDCGSVYFSGSLRNAMQAKHAVDKESATATQPEHAADKESTTAAKAEHAADSATAAKPGQSPYLIADETKEYLAEPPQPQRVPKGEAYVPSSVSLSFKVLVQLHDMRPVYAWQAAAHLLSYVTVNHMALPTTFLAFAKLRMAITITLVA